MTDAPITYEQATKLWDEGKAAYDAGDFQTAWTTWYGLYGAGITIEKQTQAGMALAIGQAVRRLGRFEEAQSWFTEAMSAPGADAETQQKAAAGIRQARLENSGDAYDLDDSEQGGGITYEQASKLWDEGKAAYDAGDFQTAWTTWYGLYGAGITIEKQTQAGMALAIGQALRRLGRFTEAESYFNEAMAAPGADAETQQKAAAGIRQARLENSGDAYDLDDSEQGGGITYEQASKLWDEGKAAYDAGDYQTAWTTWYGLYGAGITVAKQTQAGMALAMAQSLRRLGRFTEAESWFNEAMNAPGADGDTQQKAAAGIRQARLENSGDAYDLDDA